MKILILMALLPCFSLGAEENYAGKPDWYVYRKGLEHYRNGDHGAALKAVKELQDPSRVIPPEAYALLGRIYREEGENDLAERYLKQALEKSGLFVVPDEKYAIQYLLADIHYQRKSYKNYENVLENILSNQATYAENRYSRLRDGYLKTAVDENFDAFVRLYRLKDDFSRPAHLGLGIFAVRTGRESKAVLHLLFANLAAVSTLIDTLKDRDPDFVFTTLRDLLEKSGRLTSAAEYVEESELHKGLYFLAAALHGSGARSAARELWEIVRDFGGGEWKVRSRNQLASPQPEPLIAY